MCDIFIRAIYGLISGNMKISYNWLKAYIAEPLPKPEKLGDVLTFALCEIESIDKLPNGDAILDLNILPNRAHDLLSHQGVAREVAGILGLTYKDPTPLYKIPESKPTTLNIAIETPTCRRYMGRIVRNIKVGPSPAWVVEHLESIGQRSINNIVDATNIVMFDCGQPCHAFDLVYVPKIVVKNAAEGEEFPVLGREQIVAKLKSTDMMITDGEKSLAIAGVKGGLVSGVTDGTTDIMLEVANFDSIAVRKTARRLNLLSDSAKRFENDLSPSLGDFAMLELSTLIAEMCPDAVFEDIVDVYPSLVEKRTVTFSTSKINTMLGTNLSHDEMIAILTKYGYEISSEGDVCTLQVPPLRLDLTGTHDIAEEVLRLYGLDKITPEPLKLPGTPKVNKQQYQTIKACEHLIALGYREVLMYSFRKKGVYEVARGVGDKGALRTDLVTGLKESYELNRLNAPLLGIQDLKLFEIGAVFPKEGEIVHIALADKKGITEMTLDEYCAKENIVVASSYDLPEDSMKNATTPFVQWSQYPFVARDVAVWVSHDVSATAVSDILKAHMGDLVVRGPELFDSFEKDGKVSYAFRIVFQSYEKTLTDDEVNPVMETIYKALQERGWEIR
jgi:phenylalanyl-tRNA synthetase beta subunit